MWSVRAQDNKKRAKDTVTSLSSRNTRSRSSLAHRSPYITAKNASPEKQHEQEKAQTNQEPCRRWLKQLLQIRPPMRPIREPSIDTLIPSSPIRWTERRDHLKACQTSRVSACSTNPTPAQMIVIKAKLQIQTLWRKPVFGCHAADGFTGSTRKQRDSFQNQTKGFYDEKQNKTWRWSAPPENAVDLLRFTV